MPLGISVGVVYRKNFKTLNVVMGILVIFVQLILWQMLFKFFAPELRVLHQKWYILFAHFSIYVCKMKKSLLPKRSKLLKNCRLFTKITLKMADGGGRSASPTSP